MLFLDILLLKVSVITDLLFLMDLIDFIVFTDLKGLESEGADVILNFFWLDAIDFLTVLDFLGEDDPFFFLVDLVLKGLS